MYYKIIKTSFCFLLFICGLKDLRGQVLQKVGDQSFVLNPSAVFELESKTKGFLPPRMSNSERDAIVSPAAGLVVFNTSTNSLDVNEGTSVLPKWNSVKSYLPLSGGVMTGDIKGINLTLNHNASGNGTEIGGGTTTGSVILGGSAAQFIDIGTGAAQKTVTVGSLNTSSSTIINSGTGGLNLNPSDGGSVMIGSSSGTGAITLGASSNSQVVNIGSGTGNSIVNIATSSGSNTVLIGGSFSASSTDLQSGSGGLKLNPGSSGQILIGNSAGEGSITVGSSTSAQTINLGTGAGASTVNIATGSSLANSITIGGAKSLLAVGGAPLEPSAALSVNTLTKGFLPPRLSTVDRNAIVSPASGLIIYNNSTNTLEVNTGTPAAPVWSGAASSSSLYPAISNRLTASYSVLGTDSTVMFDATAANITASLPAASGLKGKIIYIRKDDSSTHTLTITPSVLLYGVLTPVSMNYLKTIKLQSNGTDWVVIDDF